MIDRELVIRKLVPEYLRHIQQYVEKAGSFPPDA